MESHYQSKKNIHVGRHGSSQFLCLLSPHNRFSGWHVAVLYLILLGLYRFEYGEMNITKLNHRIDDIEDEIYREKMKIQKCADEMDDTFDDMLAHYWNRFMQIAVTLSQLWLRNWTRMYTVHECTMSLHVQFVRLNKTQHRWIILPYEDKLILIPLTLVLIDYENLLGKTETYVSFVEDQAWNAGKIKTSQEWQHFFNKSEKNLKQILLMFSKNYPSVANCNVKFVQNFFPWRSDC